MSKVMAMSTSTKINIVFGVVVIAIGLAGCLLFAYPAKSSSLRPVFEFLFYPKMASVYIAIAVLFMSTIVNSVLLVKAKSKSSSDEKEHSNSSGQGTAPSDVEDPVSLAAGKTDDSTAETPPSPAG